MSDEEIRALALEMARKSLYGSYVRKDKVQYAEDMVVQHFQRTFILEARGHDEIRPAFAGLNELQVHGADELQILLDDALQCTSALQCVTLDAPQDADVRVGVHEDLDIQLIP